MDWVQVFVDATRSGVGVPAAGFALAAIGLNIHYGYTGLLNFGQVAFMMVGAYGLAITVDLGGPFLLGVAMGGASAVVLALILGIPTLRLRADYLAIVTIASAEMLRLVFRSRWSEPLTSGVFGIQRFAGDFYDVNPIEPGQYGVGDVVFSDRQLWVMVVGWSAVALCLGMVWLLVRSPWGRVVRSIREDEDAARSLGKNVVGYKLQSLVLGGVIGALGGMLLAVDQQSVNPDAYSANLTFYAFAMMIIGGAGTVIGPALGSILFWLGLSGIDSLLRQWMRNDVVVTSWLDPSDLGPVRFVLVGAAIATLVVFRPQGILGNREEASLEDA